MAVTNNTMILRRELLTRIIKLLHENTLEETIDRSPYQMRPKGYEEVSRCCIYKDRAMLKYRAMGVLGFGIDEEEDEMTTLAEYTRMAFAREHVSENPLSVMTDACSACVKVNYVVTNMCRGCVARPCEVNCNKDAIHFVVGDGRIYTSAKQFRSAEARKLCAEWIITHKHMTKQEKQLDALRLTYARSEEAQRRQMAPTILQLEKEVEALRADNRQAEARMRAAELQQK